jgi:hypothetical protein
MIRVHSLVVTAVLVIAAGCGQGGKPPAYPVEGKLIYPDGTPVSGSVVLTFRTMIDGVEYVASGEVQDGGRFDLTTYLPSDGAVAGEHRISAGWVPRGEVDTRTPSIGVHYATEETSGLTATITPGRNTVTLTVEKPTRNANPSR